MNEQELIELEATLREILTSSGLQWILDDVDTALSSGQSVLMQRRRSQSSYEEAQLELVGPIEETIPVDEKRPAKSRNTISTNIPFARRQRVEILLSAIRRAATELPEIQEDTLKILNSSREDKRPSPRNPEVESVNFLAEDDGTGSGLLPTLPELTSPDAVARRTDLLRALSDLAEDMNE